jgi:AraC-like DNA-binding protein
MLDDLRRFSTDAFPEALRQSALDEVLARALTRSEAAVGEGLPPLQGHVSSRSSTLDSVFVRLAFSPQVLMPDSGNARHSGRAVLLFVLLKGSGVLQEQGASVALTANAAVLLDPAEAWRLVLQTDCRALLVKLESASFLLRLVRTCSPEAKCITPAQAVGAMCLAMAESLAEQIDHLGRDDLLSVEATLTDLLVTCLSREVEVSTDLAAPSDQPTSVQLSHLRRICRTIEARLGDAELSVESVARVEGLSTRYLQKLFKVGATSFSEYLRERRLERCRLDLANRALNHFTISEMCFRWGFGDAANFSRAFTARYGVSPKAYRAQPASHAQALHDQRGRPLKGSEAKPAPAATAAAAARTPHSPFQALLGDHARYAVALALTPKRSASSAADGAAPNHYYLPVSDKTVHWGYLSRSLKPVISVRSGDVVTIETLTQHASDDCERMIDGDPGAESVFHWTADKKAVDRRGAGPMDASIFGRGAGEGFGVHICTGPVYVHDAEPGDVLEIRILDVQPRPSCSAAFHGRIFGSNAAAWWGFHYRDQITEPKRREVVTIYEIDNAVPQEPVARAVYNFRWTPQTDPLRRAARDHRLPGGAGRPRDHRQALRRAGKGARAAAPAFRHAGRGAARGGPGRFDSAWLLRRQSRQLARGQGREAVPAGVGARRAVLGRRPARVAGRFGTVRHGHRMLADGGVPAGAAQARADRGRVHGGVELPLSRNRDRMGGAGLQLCQPPDRAGCPSRSTRPCCPPPVQVPAGNKVAMETVGVGEITYECSAKAMAGQFEWVFVGPDAKLNDRGGKQVGKYYGPPATWESMDGSKVTATQVAVAPNGSGNIPSQLVKANPAMGSGAMSGVTYIQRVDTQRRRRPGHGLRRRQHGRQAGRAIPGRLHLLQGGCLAGLEPARRDCILYAYVEGCSHGEIAERLKTPLGTVKAWIQRGMRALRECMA